MCQIYVNILEDSVTQVLITRVQVWLERLARRLSYSNVGENVSVSLLNGCFLVRSNSVSTAMQWQKYRTEFADILRSVGIFS